MGGKCFGVSDQRLTRSVAGRGGGGVRAGGGGVRLGVGDLRFGLKDARHEGVVVCRARCAIVSCGGHRNVCSRCGHVRTSVGKQRLGGRSVFLCVSRTRHGKSGETTWAAVVVVVCGGCCR